MKITKHVTFFYLPQRLQYVNAILEATNNYDYETDVFIHTNNPTLTKESFAPYTRGNLSIVCHDLTGIHPFFLTWKCRELLQQQQELYDIFMYVEDDILVPKEAVAYWLQYHSRLQQRDFNLGFVRIEYDGQQVEHITDICHQLSWVGNIDNEPYVCNQDNPYCAFWIYDRNQFSKFLASRYYHYDSYRSSLYHIREASAIGMHGLDSNEYRATMIPLVNNRRQLHPNCRIFHLPNNYVSDPSNQFATIRFVDVVVPPDRQTLKFNEKSST